NGGVGLGVAGGQPQKSRARGPPPPRAAPLTKFWPGRWEYPAAPSCGPGAGDIARGAAASASHTEYLDIQLLFPPASRVGVQRNFRREVSHIATASVNAARGNRSTMRSPCSASPRSIRKTYICTTGVKGRGSATRAKSRKGAVVLALALWSGLAILQPAHGQTAASDYPQRAVTFLCPFPAGGGTDILTRMLAQELQEKLARAVIVDNRPGAG